MFYLRLIKIRNILVCLLTLENTEGTIHNGQSRETGNIGYKRRRQTKQRNKRRRQTKQGYKRRRQTKQEHITLRQTKQGYKRRRQTKQGYKRRRQTKQKHITLCKQTHIT